MFIDFLPLMLVNMVAGLVILALFLVFGVKKEDKKSWVPPFFFSGLIAFLTGAVMTLTWPLPGSYNIPYGQLSVLFGSVYLMTAWALYKEWSLMPLSIYNVFAGLAAVVVGVRFINLGLGREPLLTGIAFILTGSLSMLSPIFIHVKEKLAGRLVGAALLFLAAFFWAQPGYSEYWDHLESFASWQPNTMLERAATKP